MTLPGGNPVFHQARKQNHKLNERRECMNDADAAAGSGIGLIIMLAIFIFYIIVGWKIYTKAGQPGWASIIPIYNTIVLLQIVGRPIWWFILLLIPFVNFIIAIIVLIDFAKSFGKGTGWAILSIFFGFITYPILAFGSDTYQGPAAASS
jgi:hypothetical protein